MIETIPVPLLFRRALRWIGCAAVVTSTSVAGEPIPATNLGFESWDAAKAAPVGWFVGARDDYRLSADCAKDGRRCVVKLERRGDAAGAMQFVPVSQSLPAQLGEGHAWKLSGRVRTEGVTGWAGLWMRVDAGPREMISLDNMHGRGPRGTTEWQRVDVSQPVPAGASHVVFGLVLSGTGTAWFEDLALELDRSVSVAPHRRLARPPRPAIDKTLLDDAALVLPRDERPAVREAWRDDVARRARVIRSLFSDDFSDLQFLKPLLEGRRVVQLGESGHGVAEFSWIKVRLIKFLHQEMGYDVVAFESSLSACELAGERIGKAAPADVMRDCIFPVWHSTETLGLFEYLDAAGKAGRALSLTGFDVQKYSGRAEKEVTARLKAMAAAIEPALGARIEDDEKRFQWRQAGNPDAIALVPRYEEASARFERERARLLERFPAREVDLAIRELQSRGALARMLALPPGPESFGARDRGMADNLDFVLDRLYPGRKVIVWAHNSHIARASQANSQPHAMGSWLAQRRKPGEVYAMGLYMGRGTAAHNNRRLYEIRPAEEDSLEAVLANAGVRMSFVDFSRATRSQAAEWIFEPIFKREWGLHADTMVPARAFDGILYIDRVTPPEYL